MRDEVCLHDVESLCLPKGWQSFARNAVLNITDGHRQTNGLASSPVKICHADRHVPSRRSGLTVNSATRLSSRSTASKAVATCRSSVFVRPRERRDSASCCTTGLRRSSNWRVSGSSARTMIASSLCLRRSTGYDSPSMCVYRHSRRRSVDPYTTTCTLIGAFRNRSIRAFASVRQSALALRPSQVAGDSSAEATTANANIVPLRIQYCIDRDLAKGETGPVVSGCSRLGSARASVLSPRRRVSVRRLEGTLPTRRSIRFNNQNRFQDRDGP